MRSEHVNSLHFISSAVHFLYNNFPKKSIFSTQTSPKEAIFREKNQKNRPPTPRVGPPPPPPARRADPPTLADPAIPKTGGRGSFFVGDRTLLSLYTRAMHKCSAWQ